MLYTIDRVQYANTNGQYYFFEFMEVNNINGLIGNNNQLLNQGHFWEALFTMISNVEVGKINFLRGYQHAVRLFIFINKELISTF